MTEEYPQVPGPDEYWELRFTAQALEDLGATSAATPQVADVRRATGRKDIIDEFSSQRTVHPGTTGGHLHSVGVPDIAELHGPNGARACTWYDAGNQVCWFLGFTSQHNYLLFEQRAAVGELLPSEDDEVKLEIFREKRAFAERVAPGVRQLARKAITDREVTKRGTVGFGLLRLEVTASAVPGSLPGYAHVYVSVRYPIDADHAEMDDWPAGNLGPAVAAVLSGDYEWTDTMPDGAGGTRPVIHAHEMAFVARDVPEDI